MPHVLPSGGGKALMNAEDSVLLLLDHQSGLFQTVKDITVAELRANVMALARIATLLKLPVITTASVPDGPNGPLMPETAKLAPHAVYVPRHGEVNAWDNDNFVKAVRDTGKKTLIMAGVWTGVCVMFPALDAKAAGFNVYAVIDASGDPSEMVSRTTLARFVQSGIVPTTTNAVICEPKLPTSTQWPHRTIGQSWKAIRRQWKWARPRSKRRQHQQIDQGENRATTN